MKRTSRAVVVAMRLRRVVADWPLVAPPLLGLSVSDLETRAGKCPADARLMARNFDAINEKTAGGTGRCLSHSGMHPGMIS